MQNPIIRCVCLAFACALLVPSSIQAQQQQRDHLTEMEGDLIRETAPILDQRIEVFIKAADRRLLVLTNPNATQKKKEEEKWGPLPQGSHFELITDIKNLFSEAMEKLDDANERKDPLLAKALNKFKEAAVRQIAEMKALAPKISDARAQRALAEAIAEAEVASKGSIQ
jgi:hypothetical protein